MTYPIKVVDTKPTAIPAWAVWKGGPQSPTMNKSTTFSMINVEANDEEELERELARLRQETPSATFDRIATTNWYNLSKIS